MYRLPAEQQEEKNRKIREFLLSEKGIQLGHFDASKELKKLGIDLSGSRVTMFRQKHNLPWFNCKKIMGKVRYAIYKGIPVDYTYITTVLKVDEVYAYRIVRDFI